MIELSGVSKHYGRIVALSDVTFRIDSGVVGLLGPNGAGKTTAIQLITGILNPSSGNAMIYGHNLVTDIDGVRQSLGLCQ